MKIKRFKDTKKKRKIISESEFKAFLNDYEKVQEKKRDIALIMFDFLNEKWNANLLLPNARENGITDIEKISFDTGMISVSYFYGRSNNEKYGHVLIMNDIFNNFINYMEDPELFRNSSKYNPFFHIAYFFVHVMNRDQGVAKIARTLESTNL